MFNHFLNGSFIRSILAPLTLASLVACGGGSSGTPTTVSSTATSSAPAVSSSSSSSTSSNPTIASVLMGGAIQGMPLNISTSVSTLAGTSPGADGTGAAARFRNPNGIVRVDTNLYVADTINGTIRKIVIATGTVTTIAGTAGVTGSIDGIGMAARFYSPTGITSDGTSLYVTDRTSRTIRKIVIATGVVTTLAGGKTDVTGSDDGIGASARFYNPIGITTDGINLYVIDQSVIRKIVIATREVTTIAGKAGSAGNADGIGQDARFLSPMGIAIDGGNLYVADTQNQTIRKIILATNSVTTLAGTTGVIGKADGTGTSARFNYPESIAIVGANIYVSDAANKTVRKITIATGEVTTVINTAGLFGNNDAAIFLPVYAITTDGISLYVADSYSNVIRTHVLETGTVSILVGRAETDTDIDGTGAAARFNAPEGIATDGTRLYVADTLNSSIRQIVISTGVVSTLAGATGINGSSSGETFSSPFGITTDGTNVYVTNFHNQTIRQIAIATGKATTLAGEDGVRGSADGIGKEARFFAPADITTDGKDLYVADSRNSTIRKISITTGTVTTLAGIANSNGSIDGIGATARFYNPLGIVTDGTHLYVVDAANNTIRKIVISTGLVSTLAGTAGIKGSVDGIGAAASFDEPVGITTDGTNLYVTEQASHTIRKIVIATGTVTTLAGMAKVKGSVDGNGLVARFNRPNKITTNGYDLFVTDTDNNTIRKIH